MKFTVTYRGADGSLREECVDAANRAGCLAVLKSRGITAVGIREGGAPHKERAAAAPKASHGGFPLKTAILVVAVLAVGVAAWWYVNSSKVNPPRQTKPSAKPKPIVVQRQPANTAVVSEPAKPQRTTFKAKTQPEKTAEVEPPEITHAKILEFYHSINPTLVRDHELFKHDSDIMIADVITARPGERLIDLELDRNFDRNFAESLAEPIAPHEKDTEDDKLVKESVMKTREMLAESMAAGESPAKIIKEARDDLNKIADYRDLLESELHKLAEKEDEQYLDDFVAEANKLLDEYGAFHIKLGKRTRAKVRERMEAQGAAGTQGGMDAQPAEEEAN